MGMRKRLTKKFKIALSREMFEFSTIKGKRWVIIRGLSRFGIRVSTFLFLTIFINL